MLAHLGAAAGADRAYLFQNVRDPQGRLWMDLRAEWDAAGHRAGVRGPRQPPAPVRPGVHASHRPVLARRRARRARARHARVGASGARARRRAVDPVGAGLRARRMVGVPGLRRLHRRTRLDRRRDRRPARRGRQPRRALRSRAGRAHPGARGGALPLDGRARPGGQLHRRHRRAGLDDLHQPADRGPARVLAEGVGRGPRDVAEATAPRRSSRGRSPRTSGTTRPASRSAWSTACSTATATSCGCTTRRRWCATNAACRASRTA